MKRIYITFLISLFTLGIHAREYCKSNDNLYLNIGAGFLVGDNGQPSAISNIAVAWDANIGYWFGTSKYAGIRIGYTGDILQSFNYIGNKSYGWNTLYVDGLLNLSNFICKTKLSNRDPLWYCAPFISLECLVPMANNQHRTALGLGMGIANEINVHDNVSVTLDWRNTIAFADGMKWLPEVSAGLKFYFTGKARIKLKPEIEFTPDTIPNCQEKSDSIADLKSQIGSLELTIDSLNNQISIIESDTSIYHLEDRVIKDFVILVSKVPYHDRRVKRAITLIPMIKDDEERENYQVNIVQLQSYYALTSKLYKILLQKQQQLGTDTFNKTMWERALLKEINNFKNSYEFYRLFYIKDVIEKIEKEMKKKAPDFSDIIAELDEALQTKK